MTHSTFEGVILVQTGRAVRFSCYYWEDNAALWFPTSQLRVTEEGDLGHAVIEVRDWLVNKRGLMEFTFYSQAEIELMDAQ